MDNTYTLIGLSVITICCIYLFYLNFKMSKEHEAIKNQISNVKFIVDTHTNALHIVEKHLQNNFNTRNSVPPPSPASSSQQSQDSSISPQQKQQVSLPVEIKNNDENENETNSINLDENEIDEINKLDNEMEDEMEDEIEIEHEEEEEVIEEFLIDEPFQAPPSSNNNNNNTPLKFEDLNNLDDIEDLEVEVEDLNQHSIPIIPTTTENENENSKLENEFDGLSFTNLKIITKEELNNSSLKQLKIIAKNCGVVSRGSKETLIAAISKKIQSS